MYLRSMDFFHGFFTDSRHGAQYIIRNHIEIIQGAYSVCLQNAYDSF